MFFVTDEFMPHGRDFHLNRLIQEMDPSCERPPEF
jgi:hypothetical protein